MSNYTKITDFTSKDSLPSGDPNKLVKGELFANEFNAISEAIATKVELGDIAQPNPLPIPRVEFSRYDVGFGVEFINEKGVVHVSPISFTANGLRAFNTKYRLSLTFSIESFLEIQYGNFFTSTRAAVYADLFVRVTETSTGEFFDTPSSRLGSELAATTVSTDVAMEERWELTIPNHIEYFIDLSLLPFGSNLRDYTFTLCYSIPNESQRPSFNSDFDIVSDVDFILEELI